MKAQTLLLEQQATIDQLQLQISSLTHSLDVYRTVKDFVAKQHPLPADFQRVLNENRHELYEE